ncbi:MAG: flavin reductase family protein [Actinomycetia bacterium]|nr:flavin reductase family protein [Actinomycetes bacterium]
MAVRPDLFRQAMGTFATGVTIVAWCRDDGTPAGMTVNALTSVSLEPTLLLFCIDRQAESHAELRAAARVAVNVLAAEQEALSRRFASKSLGPAERFRGVEWDRSPSGVPLLRGALAHLDGRIVQREEVGDHSIFLVEPEAVHVQGGRPLLFYRGTYGDWAARPAGRLSSG